MSTQVRAFSLPLVRATVLGTVGAFLTLTTLSVGCSNQTLERASEGGPAAEPTEPLADGGREPKEAAAKHQALLVSVDHGTFTVKNKRVLEGPLPRASGEARGHGRWGFEALDETGLIISQGSVAKPGEVHGEFPDPRTGKTERVDVVQDGPHVVMVRVPSGTDSVHFYENAPDGSRNVVGAVVVAEEVVR